LHLGPLFDDDFGGGNFSRNFPRSVNDDWARRFQIAAQFSFDDRAATANTAATQVTFRGNMYFARCSDGAAKTGRNFVIAQVNVSAARWANCRTSGAAHLLFSMTIEALDDTGPPAFPQSVKPLH
jgi:hypothetical protein